MKKNVKRIINLIVIFLVAIAMYIFLRNIPSMLVGKDGKTINKIEEELKAGVITSEFKRNYAFTSKTFGMDSYKNYFNGKYKYKNPLYCVQKGSPINSKGMDVDDLIAVGNSILKIESDKFKKDEEERAVKNLNTKIEKDILGSTTGIYKWDPKPLGSNTYIDIYGTYIYYYKDKVIEANAKEAYILTYQGNYKKDYEEFNRVRQEAIWLTKSLVASDGTSHLTGSGAKRKIREKNIESAENVITQANNYQTFIDKIAEESKGGRPIENQKDKNGNSIYENLSGAKLSNLAKLSKKANEGDSESAGIVLSNDTNQNEVKVTHNEAKQYIVGPFKINYIDDGIKDGGEAIFGGISDMYLVGQEGNNKIIDSSRLSFTKASEQGKPDGEFKKLKLFTPIEKAYIEGKNYLQCTDYADGYVYENGDVYTDNGYKELSYTQYYPKPNEEFYLKFEATDAEYEKITELKVEFEWMEAHAELTWYKGQRYILAISGEEFKCVNPSEQDRDKRRYVAKYTKAEIVKSTKSHLEEYEDEEEYTVDGSVPNPDPQINGDITYEEKYSYKIKKQREVRGEGKKEEESFSQGGRGLHLERISIDIPKGTEEENLQMTLAGFVWEDIGPLDNKEGAKVTGKMSSEDKFKEGVEVILYYDNGQIVKQNESNDKGEVIARSNLQNPYVTGTDGHYEFRDLDADRKYIIKYVYDGQVYEATEYTATYLPKDKYYDNENELNGHKYYNIKNSADKENIENELKAKVNDVNSGAIEIKTSETDEGREDFNKRFQTIYSAPNSYQVKRIPGADYGQENANILGYEVGSWNTIWDINVSEGSEITKYGIKGLYEEVIQTAIAKNSYKEAYIDILSDYNDNDPKKDVIRSQLQFIEDTRIVAKSVYSNKDKEERTFPLFDKFTEVFEGANYYTNKENIKGVGEAYYNTIATDKYYALYPTHLNIDFGITKREKFDLALKKDVEQVTLKINDKEHVYTYDKQSETSSEIDREGSTAANEWDIGARLGNGYYSRNNYTRFIYAEDYLYKADMYKNPAVDESGNIILDNDGKMIQQDASSAYGKSPEDELKVFVTYKLTIRNQSQNILGKVCEVVDYYDKDFTYVPDKSYIQIKRGKGKGIYNVDAKYIDNESYISDYHSKTELENYNRLYINGLRTAKEDIKLSSGQTAYIYLTFEVNKDPGRFILLDDELTSNNTIGKENLAEITAYETYYPDGFVLPNIGQVNSKTPAGMIDMDSVSGNAGLTTDRVVTEQKNNGTIKGDDLSTENNESLSEYFEDDMDKSPNIKLRLYRESENNLLSREIKGTVWEDLRDVINKNDQNTATGNGIRDEDTPIDGVTVQLVEIIDMSDLNGNSYSKEYIWKEFGVPTTEINHYFDENEPARAVSGYNKEGGTGTTEDDPIIENVKIDENGNKVKIINAANLEKLTGLGKGEYGFKSFVPGNYVVRFIYGDTVKTVIPDGSEVNYDGQSVKNKKSYNGQDYKSTIYQSHIDQNSNDSVNDIAENISGVLNQRNGDYWEVQDNKYLTYKWRALDKSKEVDGEYVNRYLNDDGDWVYVYRKEQSDKTYTYFGVVRHWGESLWQYKEIDSNVLVSDIAGMNNAQNNPELNTKVIETVPTYKNDQTHINQDNQNETVYIDGTQNGYLYDIYLADKYQAERGVSVSDAKDIEGEVIPNTDGSVSYPKGTRNYVNWYSDKQGKGQVDNYWAEMLASHSKLPQNDTSLTNTYLEKFMNNTYMKAETGLIAIECEYNHETDSDGNRGNTYKIENLDLGLEERPKAQLSVNKEVTNVRLTLADGSTLFDASDKNVTNVLWMEHKPHTNAKYEENYFANKKFTKNPMDAIRAIDASPEAQFGLIQMSMDEELMHGATIKISYKITVTNIGEVDYTFNGTDCIAGSETTKKYDRSFYYTGEKSATAVPATTKADKLVDYIPNNLQFYAADNKEWQLLSNDDIRKDKNDKTDNLINAWISEKPDGQRNSTYGYNEELTESIIDEYNTIIQTSELSNIANKELYPKESGYGDSDSSSSSDNLVLTQLITSDNDSDDLTYRNVTEIVLTTNGLGRRNAYSIVGNQDPRVMTNNTAEGGGLTTIWTREVDSDSAQIVKILPPFGNSGMPQIIAITVASVGIILVAGAIFIKKKILK